MTLFTTGFAGRDAQGFFTRLREHGVRRLIDVRRFNTSQLAGYTKRRDLPFLLAELCDADYTHLPDAAPTADLLTAYRSDELPFDAFAQAYRDGLDPHVVAQVAELAAESPSVLLCTEADAERCHRSVLADLVAVRNAPRSGNGRRRKPEPPIHL